MAFRSVGNGVVGTGTSAAVDEPPGAAVGDIVEVGIYLHDVADIPASAGWTVKIDENTGPTTRGHPLTLWKRLVAADIGVGTYTFTWTNSTAYAACAMAYSGRVRVGDPYEGTATGSSSSSTALGVVATRVTRTWAPDLCCWCTNHATNAGAWTAPAGMTERYDPSGAGIAHLNGNSQDAVTPASYGKTGAGSNTTSGTFPKTMLSALMADTTARRATTTGAPPSAAAFQPTLPAYEEGDRLELIVTGKYAAATVATINQGWTLAKAGTGGTGSAAADTGTVFTWVYMIDVPAGFNSTSNPLTAPTVTPGATAPNSWEWSCHSITPAFGMEFRDAIGTNMDCVQFGDDTNTASPLAATCGAFTGQPTQGDHILIAGVIPTDSGSNLAGSSTTVTATGLTNGHKTDQSTDNSKYVENNLGDDSAQVWGEWIGFAGTASAGVAISFAVTLGNNHSGMVVAIANRQIVPPNNLSIAGTIAQPVGAFTLTGFNDSELSIAGTIPQPVGAFSLTGFNDSDVDVAGAIPLPVGNIVLDVAPVIAELDVAGVIPLPVGEFSLVGFNDSEINIAGVIPMPVGAIDLTVVLDEIELTIAGVIPLPVGAFSLDSGIEIDEPDPVETDSDIVDDAEVDQEAHEEEWHPDVAVVEPPAPMPVAYDVLRAYTSISLSGTQPVVVDSVEVRKPRLRDRLLIDGVDVTFYNNVRTPTPDFSLIEPFTYGVCTILFPQIFPLIQTLSAITWLRRGAPVLIQRVDDEGNVVATDYRGRIMGWDTSGDFAVSVGGMFSGPASVRFRPMPMVRRIEDVGYWLMTAFRHQKQPLVYEDFGVGLITRGENYYLDHCLELCALGVKQDGSQITVHYDEDLMKWVAAPKDTTTIDATVYFDAGYMNPALTRDFTVETDEVFATAHLSDGTQILNSVWPGMQQEDPIPTYPGVLEEGDNNEDVAILIARLVLLGYLKYVDRPGGFDEDVARAIWSARADAEQLGSSDDYALDEDLWDWLWDLGAVGYTDKEARILPMAQRRKVRFWDRSATGNRIGINSFYDPVYAALTVSQKLELGHVKSKNHAVQLARTLIDYGVPNWVGTLSTVMSFVAGEHTPGDPITEADLMSGRELRPGMNLWAPLFQGGTLFHISSVDVSNDGGDVSLALDTRSRDTMQIDGILERNRENRTSPARAFWNARSSSSASDTIFNHDEHFGILGSNIDLPANEWLVYPVPAGDFGTVSQTTMRTIDDPAEFSMMVFQKKVNSEWVTARVANPLNSADEWWADESVRADFKSKGIKYAAGSEEDPCGYFPGRKSKGHDLTGRWEDEASFAYGGDSLVFWVCIYADRASVLKRGDQFAVQRELGT